MATTLLTVKQAAERLNEHPDTTRARIRAGQIKGTRLTDSPRARWRVTESALQHFVTRRTQ